MVHFSPRVLSMILPRRLAYGVGLVLFFFGITSAYMSAYGHDVAGLIGSLLMTYVGLWWMLAPSSGARGSYADEQMLRRVFGMMGLLMLTLIAMVYVPNPKLIATITLLLVTGGFWLTTNYFSFLDRGR